jgi:hypothetical protein
MFFLNAGKIHSYEFHKRSDAKNGLNSWKVCQEISTGMHAIA